MCFKVLEKGASSLFSCPKTCLGVCLKLGKVLIHLEALTNLSFSSIPSPLRFAPRFCSFLTFFHAFLYAQTAMIAFIPLLLVVLAALASAQQWTVDTTTLSSTLGEY
jgi:hypothetical protein